MKHIKQTFNVPFTYNVYFTNHLFNPENKLFATHISNQLSADSARVLFVCDRGVTACHPHLAKEIKSYCEKYDFLECCSEIITVPGGEEAKNSRKYVDRILEAVHDFNIDRHSYIVAVGGGAVLDVAGFAAAIAHRGVRHIRVPTTVLSQNDSGVGVKNGINMFGKKNFVGAFTPPFSVINDSRFLTTLEDRDWRSGIAEALKVALLKDADFFEFLAEHSTALNNRESEIMEEVIYRCAALHLEHIRSGDPFEMGSSRPLDFGHWAAHKLEQLTAYDLRHGEAVAIGISLDCTYSYLTGLLDKSSWRQIIDVFRKLGFDLFCKELLTGKEFGEWVIFEGLDEFREHLGGELTIMLLEQIGKGVEVHRINREKMVEAITLMENFSQKVEY